MRRKTKRIDFICEIILWFFSIIVIYPLLMVIITSFKTKGEAGYLNISLPNVWNIVENYTKVWEQGRIGNGFWNSVYITGLSVILILLLASAFSFILVRRNTKICRLISKFMTFGIIAPFAALPTIQLLKIIGIYGTRTSMVFVYIALYLPFSTMLFSSFIKGLPRELDEAAVIDGTKGFGMFMRVVFPLLKPVTATTGILTFMWVWNDFQYPIYLLNSSSKWTLPLSVYNFYGQYQRSWNLVCADMIIVSIPVIILYVFAQKYIIAGMTAGAVKG